MLSTMDSGQGTGEVLRVQYHGQRTGNGSCTGFRTVDSGQGNGSCTGFRTVDSERGMGAVRGSAPWTADRGQERC